MTQYTLADTELTRRITAFVANCTSWLRHRGGAGDLDWALLHGATSEELQAIRGRWKGPIEHLRKEHNVEVAQGPADFYWIVGADAVAAFRPGTPAKGDPGQGAEAADDEDAEAELDGRSPDALAPVGEAGVRIRHTAKALMGLHQTDELANPMHKATVVMLIRQASECNHWHNSAHFRSLAAAQAIASAHNEIQTPAQYQAYCRRHLRHEHMVPNIVLYRLITGNRAPTADWIQALFVGLSKRATITRDEDRKLRPIDMPPDFYVEGHPGFENPMARYIEAGLDECLVPRAASSWFPA